MGCLECIPTSHPFLHSPRPSLLNPQFQFRTSSSKTQTSPMTPTITSRMKNDSKSYMTPIPSSISNWPPYIAYFNYCWKGHKASIKVTRTTHLSQLRPTRGLSSAPGGLVSTPCIRFPNGAVPQTDFVPLLELNLCLCDILQFLIFFPLGVGQPIFTKLSVVLKSVNAAVNYRVINPSTPTNTSRLRSRHTEVILGKESKRLGNHQMTMGFSRY